MKNNKGFTLVEVLAVVVILIAVITIITPKVISSFNNSEETIYKKQIESIIDISRIYMSSHTNLLPEENENYIIKITDLQQDKLINKDDILNPKTKEPLTGCILVRYLNNKYQYDYVEEEATCNS